MGITPKAIQDLLDELEASQASRKRAWELLQEIRWILKDVAGVETPLPAKKTIDLEGRLVKDGVRKALQDRQKVISNCRCHSRVSEISRSTINAPRFRVRPGSSNVRQGY